MKAEKLLHNEVESSLSSLLRWRKKGATPLSFHSSIIYGHERLIRSFTHTECDGALRFMCDENRRLFHFTPVSLAFTAQTFLFPYTFVAIVCTWQLYEMDI